MKFFCPKLATFQDQKIIFGLSSSSFAGLILKYSEILTMYLLIDCHYLLYQFVLYVQDVLAIIYSNSLYEVWQDFLAIQYYKAVKIQDKYKDSPSLANILESQGGKFARRAILHQLGEGIVCINGAFNHAKSGLYLPNTTVITTVQGNFFLRNVVWVLPQPFLWTILPYFRTQCRPPIIPKVLALKLF